MICESKWESNALSQFPLIPSNKNKQKDKRTCAYNLKYLETTMHFTMSFSIEKAKHIEHFSESLLVSD